MRGGQIGGPFADGGRCRWRSVYRRQGRRKGGGVQEAGKTKETGDGRGGDEGGKGEEVGNIS